MVIPTDGRPVIGGALRTIQDYSKPRVQSGPPKIQANLAGELLAPSLLRPFKD